MNRLTQLTKHFVVATKLMKKCPNYKCTCLPQAKEFGKAVLVLQTHPEIIDPQWRKMNPFLSVNYMGNQMMTFNTEQLFADIDVAARPDCQCSPKVVLRSNDGVTAENPEQQHLL
jgi:hypothetical protein